MRDRNTKVRWAKHVGGKGRVCGKPRFPILFPRHGHRVRQEGKKKRKKALNVSAARGKNQDKENSNT